MAGGPIVPRVPNAATGAVIEDDEVGFPPAKAAAAITCLACVGKGGGGVLSRLLKLPELPGRRGTLSTVATESCDRLGFVLPNTGALPDDDDDGLNGETSANTGTFWCRSIFSISSADKVVCIDSSAVGVTATLGPDLASLVALRSGEGGAFPLICLKGVRSVEVPISLPLLLGRGGWLVSSSAIAVVTLPFDRVRYPLKMPAPAPTAAPSTNLFAVAGLGASTGSVS